MIKKISKILFFLIFLMLFGSFCFFFGYQVRKKQELILKTQKEKAALEIPAGEIINVYLEKHPSPPPHPTPKEMEEILAKGIATSTFKAKDFISVLLEANIKRNAVFQLELFTEEGEKMNLALPKMAVYPESKIYRNCCFFAPEKPGKYTLKLFFDNKEVKTLDFEVIP